ncbi:glycosyl hydrolase family 18 protein [Aquimarina sp. I32.4]|uniref:glycosyl hydrolase family 18 protein n=1 Tax=Aquimarina sp. I32.4 TaxID=2053903 RepID=UPI001304F77C|nr:glycosyl hydrolase family 18 protein [Aquimarina sp. I32.4]
MALVFILGYTSIAQINSGGSHTTANHSKQVIGYVPNWDAWKGPKFDVLAKSLNHYNIDYSQYTILNFSFFGVATDGSLHSGDLRNPKIYASGEIQQPGDMLHPDANSSHDKALVLGQPKEFWGWDEKLRALGYEPHPEGAYKGWVKTATGEQGTWPLEEYLEASMLKIAHENGVKVMASIGGWSMCKHFPEMAADVTKRARFVADCKKLIDEYGFDGIDLDWEYPGPFDGMNFTGSVADYKNFTTLVKEIRAAIGPNKLITAAMSASPSKLGGLEWAELDKYMDYYNMMTYDFNGGWSNKAGHNSPLYDYPEAEYQDFSLDATYKKLAALNVNLSKVNLGVAFYGRAVTTEGSPTLGGKTKKTPQVFAVDGPVDSASDLVNFKDMEGTPYYTTILKELASGNWTENWDDTAKVPYLTHKTSNSFLSYDNERSLSLKAEYIKNKKLAGCIVWEVFSDFVVGPETKKIGKYPYCPATKAPLANVINKAFATGVIDTNEAPVVSIISPTAQQKIEQDTPKEITLIAEASDVDGTVASVTFEIGTQTLTATLVNNQYTATWAPVGFGDYSLTVTATDDKQTTTKKTVAFSVSKTVDTTNQAPVVNFIAPTTQQDIKQATINAITLIAEASDVDGTIASVTFKIGTQTLTAVLVNNQYTASWTPTAFGAQTAIVTATDDKNATAEQTVNFTVSKTTTAPEGEHPLVSRAQWDVLFPHRFGSKLVGDIYVIDPKDDFYSYDAFIKAIKRMKNIEVMFERRCGTNAYRITRTDKTTGASLLLRTDIDFDAPRNLEKEIIIDNVDYASFLEEGTLETRKRELSAFFANISHETTGGWDTAPGGRFSWGLHFNEEKTDAPYVAANDPHYPATPGQSYKGRGPIQLSYNFNYGAASHIIFGDKQILLDNPGKVLEDSALAFETAIWFWMTPQYPKPSAHTVMADTWIPNELDIEKNRVPGLGMTVNIINGGIECGHGGASEKGQVADRIGYYERFTGIYNIGTDMDGVNDLSDCGCKDMTKYAGNSGGDFTAEPCAQKPAITFVSPTNNQLILQNTFAPIAVNIEVDQKNSVLKTLTTTIGTQTFNGATFSWTPSGYGSHIMTSNATFENGKTATATNKVIIWDGTNLDCNEIPEWINVRIYKDKDNYVRYNNAIYRNKWYAPNGSTPGVASMWELVKECTGPPSSAPTVNWEKPTKGQIIEAVTLPTVTLTATATDSDGTVQSFSFKHNNTVIAATKTGDRYTADFTPTAFQTVTISAIAIDNDNKTTENKITFTVREKTGQNTAPSITGVSPANSSVIEQSQLASIVLKALVNDNVSISNVAFTVNNTAVTATQSPSGEYTANWTPTAFGQVTFKITATDGEGLSSESNTTFTVKKKTTGGACGDVAAWEAKVYSASGQFVSYEGKVYKNKWYAEITDIPGVSAVWSFVSDCGSTNSISANLYPTVVSDQVNISVNSKKNSALKIVLYDYSGKTVRTLVDQNISKGDSTFTEDLSSLRNGIYIYKIYIDGNVKTERLIKK